MTPKRDRSTRASSGFTMVELMFALGLLGITLPMIFSLFAAAVVETKSSFGDVMGDLICENGLVVAKASLTLSDMNNSGSLTDHSDKLGDKDTRYPAGSDEPTTWGYAVFARKAGDGNDYQLIVLSYRKNESDRRVGAYDIAGAVVSTPSGEDTSRLGVPPVHADNLRAGSPVLLATTGEYARIVTISGNTCRLDRRIENNYSGTVYVFVEETAGGAMVPIDEEPVSPVLSVLSVRTAIREQ